MAELSIDGEIFNVEVEGPATKPALVLAHTLGSTLELWDAQMPALLKHFRVIRYDSRGHGKSAAGRVPYSMNRLGRDVLAILDALEIERAHFLGMSMGGAVGQWLLVNAPERIERAVLANTAARISTATAWNARIRTVLAGNMEANAASTVERWFSGAFHETNPETVSAFRTTLRTMSPTGYAAACAALRDMDFRDALRNVRNPVLVMTGSDDPVTSASDIATMTGALPNVKHVVLKARHISNIEAPDAFTDAVVTFLTSRAPVRSQRAATPPVRATHPPRGARRTGARAAVAARRPAAAVIAKTPRTKAPVTPAAPAAKPKRAAAQPSRTVKSSRTTKVVAAHKGTAKSTKTAATRTGVRTAVATKATTTASKRAAAPSTARQRTAPTPAAKTSAAKPAARKAASAKAASTPAAKPKSVASAAKVAPKRRSTPIAAARPAKATPARKATAKSAPKATAKPATKAHRKPAAASLATPRSKPATPPGRPAGRNAGRGKGRGKS